MFAQGVKAARVFPHPDSHNFSLRHWAAGGLLESLESKRVPLFVDEEEIDWDVIHEICERHPELPLVLTNVNYRVDRSLYALWKTYSNLFIELSSYCSHGGIEEATVRFGSERLLFGSNLPFFTPGSAIGMLSCAKISESDRKRIAGDNLRRLLSSA
jgi:predicted TIM-barrel fold metal-dependent hydrolase